MDTANKEMMEEIKRRYLAQNPPRQRLSIKAPLTCFDSVPMDKKRLDADGQEWGIESVRAECGGSYRVEIECVALDEKNQRQFEGVVKFIPPQSEGRFIVAPSTTNEQKES